MMTKKSSRSQQLLLDRDAKAIAEAEYFTLIHVHGRTNGRTELESVRERVEFRSADHGGPAGALAAARAAKTKRGRDQFGHEPLIYAVTPSGMTVHVSEKF